MAFFVRNRNTATRTARNTGRHEPQVGEEPREEQHHPRRQGELGAELFEQRLELRQDVAGEQEHSAERHHHDDHRVGQCSDDLRSGVELSFEVVRKTLERSVELTGQFGGLQNADVVVREHLRVPGCGDGQQPAIAQIVDQIADGTPESDVFGLVTDRHERIGQRDPGLDEHGELTREVHQLLLLHLFLGELEVE